MTVALFLLAAAALFVAFELAARAWLRTHARAYVWRPGARVRLEVDREAAPELEAIVEHRINRDGERGNEPPLDARGTFRVLVVGGSAAECYFIDQESSWPAVLERELSEPARLAALRAERVHVGNVGRSLMTCRHLDELLARHVEGRERLDAIVLLTGASDVVSWLEKDAPRVIAEDPIPARRLFAWHPEGPFGWRTSTLALRRIAVLAYSMHGRPIDRRKNVGRRLAEQRRMRAEATEIVRTVPDPTPLLAHFERWFEPLVRRAQRSARFVIVARQPWLERDFSPEEARRMWSLCASPPNDGRVTKYYAHDVAWRLLKLVDQRAATIARELGAAQVELNVHVAPTLQNYYDDFHHTPRGCALIGEAVARALLLAASERREIARTAVDAPSMVELASGAEALREAG